MDPNQTAQQSPFAPVNPQDNQSPQTTIPAASPLSGNKPGQLGGLDATPIENVTSIYQSENTIHKRFETPQTPEVNRPVETEPTQELPGQEIPDEPAIQDQTPEQQPATATPKAGVVDKTKIVAKLHPITNTTDTLTTLADQEEEEFIQQVEAAHGIK